MEEQNNFKETGLEGLMLNRSFTLIVQTYEELELDEFLEVDDND